MGNRQKRVGGRSARAGFALIEVMIAMTILVVAVSGAFAVMTASMRSRETVRETMVAQLAARQALETLKLTDFSLVFVSYNTSDADDPGVPGTADGEGFEVAGLAPVDGDADGLVGRYVFPSDPADVPEILREDIDDRFFGMPRDLTGEGTVDGNDHALDYRLLPVAAVIEWRSNTGQDRSLRFETYLTQ